MDSSKLNQILHSPRIREIVRFVIVGTIATGIHYGIYLLLVHIYGIEQTDTIRINIAYSVGYAISFICNMLLTASFTFREKLTIKRGSGFVISHIINYLLHLLFLSLFLWMGLSNKWAPIPVYCMVVPINYLLVRTVFKSNFFKK